MAASLTIGLVLFPRLTQLDLTGPYEVFARIPDAEVLLLSNTLTPVISEKGLAIVPTCTFANCPDLDILCVPGGPGINGALLDDELLTFLRAKGPSASYVTSVCTGSLILARAGLLKGYRATTHWLSMDLLRLFGIEAIDERVVIDRNRITGGGVTAGIDFGLTVVAKLYGNKMAQAIQLMMEYNPQPPFESGHPSKVTPEIVAQVRQMAQVYQDERAEIIKRIVALG